MIIYNIEYFSTESPESMPLNSFKIAIATEVVAQMEERLSSIETKLQELLMKINQQQQQSAALKLLRTSLQELLE